MRMTAIKLVAARIPSTALTGFGPVRRRDSVCRVVAMNSLRKRRSRNLKELGAHRRRPVGGQREQAFARPSDAAKNQPASQRLIRLFRRMYVLHRPSPLTGRGAGERVKKPMSSPSLAKREDSCAQPVAK